MKQGSTPSSSLANNLFQGQQLREVGALCANVPAGNEWFGPQGDMLKPMTATGSRNTSMPSISTAMPMQLMNHMQSVPSEPINESNADFVLPFLSMVGHVPIQVLLLKARVQFTQMVEESMMECTLSSLCDRIKLARSAVISSSLQNHPTHEKKALDALQTVLQEQQNTAKSLGHAHDHATVWEGEMRFYAQDDGSFTCKCLGKTVQIRAEHMDPSADTVLVTTDVTKEVRRAFFEAMYGGPGALTVCGPAGTGKTETIRDICNMLGLSAAVVLASDEIPGDTAYWQQITKRADVIIIDEATNLTKATLEAAVQCAQHARVPLCMSYNPESEGLDDVREVLGKYKSVRTRLPHIPTILSTMLATEGLQQADNLGDRLDGFFQSMKAGCTKQPYYDWGLRMMKAVGKTAGTIARGGNLLNERQVLTEAVQLACASRINPLDEGVFYRAIVGHFGADAFVPMQMPSDFWNATAAKITNTMECRHGGLCLPVTESEESFIMAVIEEEAQRAGADIVCMPGTMSGMSEHELFGSVDIVTHQWTDGAFSQCLRDTVRTHRPGWLVICCGEGKVSPEKWEYLNTLLDDNKTLTLINGERISLKPKDRVIFVAPNLDASPATVSRLGIINVEGHRRQKL